MKRPFLYLMGALFMVTVALIGCSSDSNENDGSGDTSEQDTLIYGRGADATRLDPARVTDGESLKVTQQIMETLVNFTPGTTDLEPGLATEWDQSEDGKTYTFELRENVTFQDGSDFDADAVVYNFERWQNGSDEDNFAYYPSMFGGFGDDSVIEDVEAVDDHTVE